MERCTPQSVGDVLRNLLEETSLHTRMEELKAASLWPRIAGEELAGLCGKPTVKNGVLTIPVPVASLRQELSMNRSRLKEIFNSNFDKEIINDIRFTS